MYVDKNHMNCEWAEGIPYSPCKWSIEWDCGRGSAIKYFSPELKRVFANKPMNNEIWKRIQLHIKRAFINYFGNKIPRNIITLPYANRDEKLLK